jgi:hypothetical protein
MLGPSSPDRQDLRTVYFERGRERATRSGRSPGSRARVFGFRLALGRFVIIGKKSFQANIGEGMLHDLL